MKLSPDKARRLERVARLYYEQERTQDQIARELGVSRPLISRLLQDAKDAGIVEIRIRSLGANDELLLRRLKDRFGIQGGVFLPDEIDNNQTNIALARGAIDCVHDLGGGTVGLGWGHVIGTMVEVLEQRPLKPGRIKDVCPMVGNSNVSIRNYHSNENVRIVAHQTMATPHFLHMPAFAETQAELDLWRQTENYRAILAQWENLDVALVNIGNYPSTPDFASHARFGNLLSQRKAVGRMIAYYYDSNGEFIQSDFDFAVQIPLQQLRSSGFVVGLCSANLNVRALVGALKSGILTHLVAREELVREALGQADY